MVYGTKMKKNLKYEILLDAMEMNSEGKMEYREQIVVFRKGEIWGTDIYLIFLGCTPIVR